MIVEHALLTAQASREAAFEDAFARARPLIEAQPGFLGLSLARGVERPNTYLLRVE